MFVDTEDKDFGYDDLSDTSDNDYNEAWDELNEFLSSPGSNSSEKRKYTTKAYSPPTTPEILRPDYRNLGVPFGSDFNITRKAYKRLITKYHPDKNNDTPEYLHNATEKSKNLNISYQKIKAWELAKKG